MAEQELKLVKVVIDDQEYHVPAGMNLVDAAKSYAGNDIPVFCYHPKMEPVGMCRMCIVELGMEMRSRETGELERDEAGNPKVRWFPKLQTACTQTVSDGMYIRTNSEQVDQSRENVLEFLLTSHPLDCPICDKGGECPLQNLTLEHGPGTTRMNYADKLKLDKHVPLGDLIYLDQERCIQCARCIRFQEEVVGDDVLAFHERGRRLHIITNSDPGFDTYFSGNTTDICPVGALTTEDFRFGARPWELTEVPSLCPYSPSGANISLSTRLDRDFGGKAIVKRVMPRQNESVNEIWISDKTRFGHHFTRSDERLMSPMIRRGGSLSPTIWNEVMQEVGRVLAAAGGDVAAIAGSGATNEDLWELRQLVEGLGGDRLGAWPPTHGGAQHVASVGVGSGTNLKDLGVGDAILVIANDLEEEEPIWRLRVKQAHDRGAYLVVANARHTRLDDFASREAFRTRELSGDVIHYAPGEAAHVMAELDARYPEIAAKLKDAANLVIFAGAEGLDLAGSEALMQSAANFLIASNHYGKANNGLISLMPGPNPMGLHYLGYTPQATQAIAANPPKVLIVAQAEILDEDPAAAAWIDGVETLITLSLFPDKTAHRAHFALPIQSFAERDGSYTSGERRVQRFYTAQGPMGDALPLWKIAAGLREKVGQGRAKLSAAAVMLDITRSVEAYEGARYKALAQVEQQFPDVGGNDLYYGGTAYQNKGGLGVQIASTSESSKPKAGKAELPVVPSTGAGELLVIPTVRLYNRSNMFKPSALVHPRVLVPYISLSPADAKSLKVATGDVVEVRFGDTSVRVRVSIEESISAGVAFLPRQMTDTPTPMIPTAAVVVKTAEPVTVG